MGATIIRNAVTEVMYGGKTYTCCGERRPYKGQLMWMFRTKDGLETDILLCPDRDPESNPKFTRLITVPGQTPVDPDQNHSTGNWLAFTAVAGDDEGNAKGGKKDGSGEIIASVGFYIDTSDDPDFPLESIPDINIEYSLDGGDTWEEYIVEPSSDSGNSITKIEICEDQTVQFRGVNTCLTHVVDGGASLMCFRTSCGSANGYNLEVSGDVTSLLNGSGGDAELEDYTFYKMFYGCGSITTAPELPSTELSDYCYSSMFEGCTSLIEAPELSSVHISEGCYKQMFKDCTSLTEAPDLPAETLADYCYMGMFIGCTGLTAEPDILATSLAESCCERMFTGCSSMTNSPVLLSETLVESCYAYMFNGCTSLENITCLATDLSALYCTGDWVADVAETGTFTCANSSVNWTEGEDGIPYGWTVENYEEDSQEP